MSTKLTASGFRINDDEIIGTCQDRGNHRKALPDRPMDIEWGKDGSDGKLYILQARPETVQSRSGRTIQRFTLKDRSSVIVTGRSIGQKIGSGVAKGDQGCQ